MNSQQINSNYSIEGSAFNSPMLRGKNSIGVELDELMGLTHVLNKIFEAVEKNEWRFLSKYGLLSLFFTEIEVLSDI